MAHNFTGDDGTFPHNTKGGIFGKLHKAGYNKKMSERKAKAKALSGAKESPRVKHIRETNERSAKSDPTTPVLKGRWSEKH